MLAVLPINFPSLLLNPCMLLGQAIFFTSPVIQSNQLFLRQLSYILSGSTYLGHRAVGVIFTLNFSFNLSQPSQSSFDNYPADWFQCQQFSALSQYNSTKRTYASDSENTYFNSIYYFTSYSPRVSTPNSSQSIATVLLAPRLLPSSSRFCFTRHLSA